MKIKYTVYGTLIVLMGLYSGIRIQSLRAQGTQPPAFTIIATLPSANCPLVATGVTQTCLTTDLGWMQSINGAKWTPLGGTSAVALTLQGVTKTLPASFTIALPQPATTQGPVSVN